MTRYFIRLTGSIFSLFFLLKLVGPQGRATKPGKDNQRKQEGEEGAGRGKEGRALVYFI